jgi:large subunit ribosomal protein L6
MSRVAKNPIVIPAGVEVKINHAQISVTGSKGELSHTVHQKVAVQLEEGVLTFAPKDSSILANALSGTTRALLNNMVLGVSQGFAKKLKLNGVGYRAALQGQTLNLTLGFSHPVTFAIPDGISIETPSQTEITVSGHDKQKVGQVAANIRAYRPPEPYKGKGIRYVDEQVSLKEAKKK